MNQLLQKRRTINLKRPNDKDASHQLNPINFFSLSLDPNCRVLYFNHNLEHKKALTVYSASDSQRKAENLLFVSAHLLDFNDDEHIIPVKNHTQT